MDDVSKKLDKLLILREEDARRNEESNKDRVRSDQEIRIQLVDLRTESKQQYVKLSEGIAAAFTEIDVLKKTVIPGIQRDAREAMQSADHAQQAVINQIAKSNEQSEAILGALAEQNADLARREAAKRDERQRESIAAKAVADKKAADEKTAAEAAKAADERRKRNQQFVLALLGIVVTAAPTTAAIYGTYVQSEQHRETAARLDAVDRRVAAVPTSLPAPIFEPVPVVIYADAGAPNPKEKNR